MNKKKIAVIGSGISGLSASFFLSKNFEVTLFEKNKYLGGHTRTIKVADDQNNYNIDTGFIVFNENNYPLLKNFFDYLSVETAESDMSFAVSSKFNNIEYGGKNIFTLFAQPKNIFSSKFLMLVFDIIKFYNECRSIDLNEEYKKLNIEEFLNLKKYDNKIRDLHLYPIISSIWSSNNEDVKKFPLISFINFFKNHGLFNFKKRPQWKYVKNGSNTYIKNLINKKLFKYFTNYKIYKVKRSNNKIYILNNKKEILEFDKIIFATHANEVLDLIEKPTKKEINILSKFLYTKNTAYLHNDKRFMPRNLKVWSSWNFIQNTNNAKNFSLSYWMNNLQKLNSTNNYFVTINPFIEPREIIDRTIFNHPVFNLDTIQAQKKIREIQGEKNTFFCGSYCGYGFHEDGIQSAAFISNMLDTDMPWSQNNKFYNRLLYNYE